MQKWQYNGPVGYNNNWSGRNFKAETMAESQGKALSNIRFRYAKEANINIRYVQLDKKYLHEVG